MTNYAVSLAALQSAMLDNNPQAVVSLLNQDGQNSAARLNVYIEGYRTRLIDVVFSDYPTLAYHMGENEIKKYSRAYIEANPSSFYTLDAYPVAFADFIASHSDDKIAISIARLESAIAEVFWMRDSDAFILPAAFGEEQLMELRLSLRKASKLLVLTHPVNDYLLAVRQDLVPEVPVEQTSYLFVVRHLNEVKRHKLSDLEYEALIELSQGKSVGEMLEILAERHSERLGEIVASLSEWFSKWITEGFFSS